MKRYIYTTKEEYAAIVEEMAQRILDIQRIKQNVESCTSHYRRRIPLNHTEEAVFVTFDIEFCTGDLLQILSRLRKERGDNNH